MSEKKQCIAGGVLLAVGLVLLAFVLVIFFVVPVEVNKAIDKGVVVTSPSSKGYDAWVTSSKDVNPDNPDFYRDFYFWNLTNYPELISGEAEKPVFNKCGPYSFVEVYHRVDPAWNKIGPYPPPRFSEDQTNVTYSTYYEFFWNPSTSAPGLSLDDEIIGMNGGYLLALQIVERESVLALISANAYDEQLWAYLLGEFSVMTVNWEATQHEVQNRTELLDVIQSRNPVLLTQSNEGGSGYGLSAGGHSSRLNKARLNPLKSLVLQTRVTDEVLDSRAANETFCDIWANKTDLTNRYPSPYWQDMLLTPFNGGRPTNITFDQCNQLWNPYGELSFTNQAFSAQQTWYKAQSWSPQFDTLMREFSLSADQLQAIVSWREDAAVNVGFPSLQKRFSQPRFQIESFSDLGYLQWSEATVAGGSIAEFNPRWNFAPERPFVPNVQNEFLPLSLLQRLFDVNISSIVKPVPSLALPVGFSAFYAVYSNGTTKERLALQATYRLSAQQFNTIGEWTQYVVEENLEHAFSLESGAGLFVKKSVDDWLFGAIPLNANASFTDPWSTYQTGKGDLDALENIVVWENNTVLCGDLDPSCVGKKWWLTTQPVGGVGDGTEFHPHVQKDETLYAWNSDVMRVVPLTYNGTIKVGTETTVNAYKFNLPKSFFAPNATFFQPYVGLGNLSRLVEITEEEAAAFLSRLPDVPPFSNITAHAARVPLFFSQPNMYQVDAKWRDKIVGMQPNLTTDDTFVAVEPSLGVTLYAAKRLQPNFYVNHTYSERFDLFSRHVPTEVFYPLFYADEHGMLSEAQAKQIKKLQDDLPSDLNLVLYIGVPVTAAMIIAAIALLVYVKMKSGRRSGYEPLETPVNVESYDFGEEGYGDDMNY